MYCRYELETGLSRNALCGRPCGVCETRKFVCLVVQSSTTATVHEIALTFKTFHISIGVVPNRIRTFDVAHIFASEAWVDWSDKYGLIATDVLFS